MNKFQFAELVPHSALVIQQFHAQGAHKTLKILDMSIQEDHALYATWMLIIVLPALLILHQMQKHALYVSQKLLNLQPQKNVLHAHQTV